MKKAVISVFLVLTLVLNVFGFGVLEARASAEAISATLAFAILTVVAGALTGVASNLAADALQKIPSDVQTLIQNSAIDNGEVIQIVESGGNYYFAPISGLSGDTAEFADFICNYFNDRSDIDTLISGYIAENSGLHGQVNLSGSRYSTIKTMAVQAYTAYLEVKSHLIDLSSANDVMDELAAALGHEWDPTWQFDFVGPLTPIQLSDVHRQYQENEYYLHQIIESA